MKKILTIIICLSLTFNIPLAAHPVLGMENDAACLTESSKEESEVPVDTGTDAAADDLAEQNASGQTKETGEGPLLENDREDAGNAAGADDSGEAEEAGEGSGLESSQEDVGSTAGSDALNKAEEETGEGPGTEESREGSGTMSGQNTLIRPETTEGDAASDDDEAVCAMAVSERFVEAKATSGRVEAAEEADYAEEAGAPIPEPVIEADEAAGMKGDTADRPDKPAEEEKGTSGSLGLSDKEPKEPEEADGEDVFMAIDEDVSLRAPMKTSTQAAQPEAEIVTCTGVSDYVRAVSELTAEYQRCGDGTLVIDTTTGEVLTETGEVAEGVDGTITKAAGLPAEEAVSFLEAADYDVLSVKGNEVVIFNLYQTARLMVTSDTGVDTSGALRVINYENEYLLQYASPREAAEAAELLRGNVDSLDVDLPMDVMDEEELIYEPEEENDDLEKQMSSDNIASGDQGRFENQDHYFSWAVSFLGIDKVLESYNNNYAREVVVAVIDSGFNDVPGFFDENRILTPLTVSAKGDTSDCNASKHGTFIVGQIYEATPSNVKILPVRAYNDSGDLTTSQLRTALTLIQEFEKNSGIKVDFVNISLGTTGASGESFTGTSIDRVFSAMNAEGTFFMASAGNNARSIKESYPAKSRYVCAVSAIDAKGSFASSFSNYGDDTYRIAYTAPGTSMIGVYPTNTTHTTTLQGTSMASPYVTACAAIIKSQGKLANLTNADEFVSTLNYYVQADRTAEVNPIRYGSGCVAFPTEIDFSEISVRNYYFNYKDGQVYTVRPASYPEGMVVRYGSDTLIKDVDYTVTYENNIYPGVAKAIITGKGMYDGSAIANFRIYGKITDCEVTVGEAVYTGQAVEPEMTVVFHGNTLKRDEDYTLSFEDNTEVGTATATIKGTGNYRLEKKVSFSIVPCDMADVYVGEIPSQSCTGGPVEPDLVVSFQGTTLCKDVDYQAVYENNILPGHAVVTVSGLGGFVSEQTLSFDIVGQIADCVAAGFPDYSCTGAAIEPEPEVTFRGIPLEKDKDYTLTYEENIYPGNMVCVVTGTGLYEGEKRIALSIFGDFTEAVIADIPDTYCTGHAVIPDPVITYLGKELVMGKDYIVSCVNNVRPGRGYCIVTGSGFYEGEMVIGFNINGDLRECDISLPEEVPLTGEAVMPEPVVTLHGLTLEKDKDYTLSYKNNTSIGRATCTVTGIGFCSGKLNTDFNIYGDMADCETLPVKDATYTGSAITPEPEVLFRGKALVKNRDYTLSYMNNVATGTASCIMTGIGPDFAGTLETRFEITLRKTSVTSKINTASGVYLEWRAMPEADGYLVYRKTGSESYKRIATASGSETVKYTDKTAKSGVTYSYRVAAYVLVDGIKVVGQKRTVTVTRLIAPALKISNAKTGLSLSWSLVEGAEGYVVYRKDGQAQEKGIFTALTTIKDPAKLSYTDKTAESGRYYTYQVKAYNGSSFSDCSEKHYLRLDGVEVTCANKASGIRVSYKEVPGAGGYYVYRKTASEKSYTRIAATKSDCLYYNDKKVVNGESYLYQVKAYMGSYKSSSMSAVPITWVSKSAITSLKSTKAKKMTVRWETNAAATGYQIVYADNASFTHSSKVTVKDALAASKTISKLKSKCNYYVKIRSYQTTEGKNYYSVYSAVVMVKVK